MHRAYKVELDPNNRQRTLLARSAGCARFAYNWGLAQRIKLYQLEKRSTNAIEQHRVLCKLKVTEYPWMYGVTKCAPQEALRNLDSAFKNFFRRVKTGGKPGFPKFKSKHKGHDSFKVTTGAVYLTNSTVKLPKMPGTIRLKEHRYIPVTDVKYLSYTISKKAGRWFLSVAVEVPDDQPVSTPTETLGLDLGIKELGTASDGRVYHNPRAINRLERTLKRAEREKSRRKKGSRNRRKTVERLQKIHYRVSCVRKDAIHKMTSDLVKTKPVRLVIEDLSVRCMLKNHRLAKALSDASFGEVRRQLEYKAQWYGSEVTVADRWFPSSKTCSQCGQVKEDLKLSDRVYKCECGLEIDRDLNAAMNLKRYGEFPRGLSKQKACGEERSQFKSSDGAPLRSRKETENLFIRFS